MTKLRLIKAANEMGIEVMKARNSKDAQAIGVHLLNPTVDELARAVDVAERDMFPRVVIHNARTWPQSEKEAA